MLMKMKIPKEGSTTPANSKNLRQNGYLRDEIYGLEKIQ